MEKRGFGTNFHSIYARDAELYDVLSRAEKFSSELEAKIESLLIPGTLLDVACGTGHKLNLFSKYFEKAYGLDNSQTLLSFAQKQYATNKKLHFLWSSAEHIPLLDESVDTILITWGSFPLSRTIKEMKRVLKPGGIIMRIGVHGEDEFTTHFPKLNLSRIRRINSTFKSSGFIVESADVEICFKDLDEARAVMSGIVGAPVKNILNTMFKHTVAFCYYKKA